MSKIKKNVKYADILALAKEYSEKLEEVKKKQPYHLNIIEELHINENAHSRILAKLLQYKDNEGKYVFLQSLLEYINDKNGSSCDFSKINVVSPEITQEKDRIDVLVLGEKQAVIIENKICGAKDQEKQLSRYIDRIQEKGYEKADIYIVYLTEYYQSPSSDTWSSKREERNFSARFLNLSYMCDILPWLEKQVDNLSDTECFLKSALKQYIDYLQILKKRVYMEKDLKELFDGKFNGNIKNVLDGYNNTKELVEHFPTYIRELIKDKTDWIKEEDIYKEEKKPLENPVVVELKYKRTDFFLYLQLSDEFDTIKCCLEQQTGKKFNSVLLKKLKANNLVFKNEGGNTYVTRASLSLTDENLKTIIDDFKKIYDFFKEQ